MSKKIIRSNTVRADVPVLFDSIINQDQINVQESKSVSYVENGEYSVVPDSGYDAIAQVDVTVNVPSAGGGTVTSFEDPIVFDSIEDAEELNSYDVKGALVSYNASTGKYTAWNGEADLDTRAWDYRTDASSHASSTISMSGNLFAESWSDNVEFPTNEYGEVIAVCVGDGLWVSTKWISSNYYTWCKENGSIYTKQQDCLSLSGVECTANLISRVTADDQSVFWTLKNFGTDDGTQGHWYIPSKYEIFPAVINQGIVSSNTNISYEFLTELAHACHLVYNCWSSSQSVGGSEQVYVLHSANELPPINKFDGRPCLVLLHFGHTL